jgi:type II secretory pathway component PulJ
MKTRIWKSATGMTLLEVLIGVMILMIITSTLAQASWITTKGKKSIESRQLVYHQARVAMHLMIKDLELAFIMKPTLNALGRDVSAYQTAFHGIDEGEADVLHFTSLSGRRYLPDEIACDQREYSYSLEDLIPEERFTKHRLPDGARQLVRREDRILDDNVQEGGDKQVIAEGVLKFNVEYWDLKKGVWTESWDSTQRARLNTLPRAVRITLTIPNPINPENEPVDFRSVALLGMGPSPIEL